jgi:hypothetical protein
MSSGRQLTAEDLELARSLLKDGQFYCIRGSPHYMIYALPEKNYSTTWDRDSPHEHPPDIVRTIIDQVKSLKIPIHIRIQFFTVDDD